MVTLPRPLVLPVAAPAGVSLQGLVAASARLNVLGNVTSTLTAIGLPPTRPGAISLASAGREEALAARLGCTAEDVRAASTPYVGDPTDGIVRWGRGTLPLRHLDIRRRRVSPASLECAPHHRAAWMNLLLDYCPESLEPLINACPRCSRPLRWRAAWGIGHCDDPACMPLTPTAERLPSDLATGYRRFAALVSPVWREQSNAIAALPAELSGLPPLAVVDLAMKLGMAFDGTGGGGYDRYRRLPAARKARCLATGAELLESWPKALRDRIATLVASDAGRPAEARRILRAGLITAAGVRHGRGAIATLMREALPEIFVEVGGAFAGLAQPMLMGSVAANRLGISHAELAVMVRDGIFKEEGLYEGRYRRAQYYTAEIDAAAAAWRNSLSIEAVMRQLALPRYACELIVALGDVERECHPFALRLPGQPRVTSASLAAFLAKIRSNRAAEPRPADAIRLPAAMRAVGGRLKPWAQVLAAVCEQRLDCWIDLGEGGLADRMRVRSADLARISGVDAEAGVSARAYRSAEASQVEAMAILNLNQIDGPALAEAGLLNFRQGRRSLLVPVAKVLDLARERIATAEVAARLGLSPARAYHIAARIFGHPSSPAGWRRAEVAETLDGKAFLPVTTPGGTRAAPSDAEVPFSLVSGATQKPSPGTSGILEAWN